MAFRGRGGSSLGAALGFAVVLLAAALIAPRVSNRGDGFAAANLRVGEAIAGGRRIEPAELDTASPAPLLPVQRGTSRDNIEAAWVREDPGERYLFVRFTNGMTFEQRPWPEEAGYGPVKHWNRLIDQGIDGAVVDVDGRSFFVVEPSALSLGSAETVVDGEWISLVGDQRTSASELLSALVSGIPPQG